MVRLGSKLLLQSVLQQYRDDASDGAEQESLEQRYTCDSSQLHPDLGRCFVQLHPDGETREFVEKSKRKSSSICLQMLYSFVQLLLGLFLSRTAINGLLEKGRMFVFSEAQLRLLLSSFLPHAPEHPRVLDIGSGDGHVTDKIKGVFGMSSVDVAETCRVMQRVLRKRGYKVINENSWHQEGPQYDMVSCLNVLDRCARPLSMLRQITESLRPGGVLIVALVLPYEPFVERHSMQSRPSEELLINNQSWELGVSSLWADVLAPLGYTPLAASRVPYLCEGDMSTDYYALDDAVLVLRKKQM